MTPDVVMQLANRELLRANLSYLTRQKALLSQEALRAECRIERLSVLIGVAHPTGGRLQRLTTQGLEVERDQLLTTVDDLSARIEALEEQIETTQLAYSDAVERVAQRLSQEES